MVPTERGGPCDASNDTMGTGTKYAHLHDLPSSNGLVTIRAAGIGAIDPARVSMHQMQRRQGDNFARDPSGVRPPHWSTSFVYKPLSRVAVCSAFERGEQYCSLFRTKHQQTSTGLPRRFIDDDGETRH
jgi:hypothetical protein